MNINHLKIDRICAGTGILYGSASIHIVDSICKILFMTHKRDDVNLTLKDMLIISDPDTKNITKTEHFTGELLKDYLTRNPDINKSLTAMFNVILSSVCLHKYDSITDEFKEYEGLYKSILFNSGLMVKATQFLSDKNVYNVRVDSSYSRVSYDLNDGCKDAFVNLSHLESLEHFKNIIQVTLAHVIIMKKDAMTDLERRSTIKLEESTSGMRSSIVRSITNIDNMNETCEQLSSMTDEDISELYNIMMYAVYTYARELINQSKICGSIRTRINNNPLSYGGISTIIRKFNTVV